MKLRYLGSRLNWLFITIFWFISFVGQAQTPYYYQRATLFENLPSGHGEILFVGNSITDGGEWNELFQDARLKNRGISGDVTSGVLARISEIYLRKPSKVFLLIGINDLRNGLSPDSIAQNIFQITRIINEQSPETKIYVQSVLPVNKHFTQFSSHTAKANLIPVLNKLLQEKADVYKFVDLFSSFSDADGNLKAAFTNDGLHLTGEGYRHWKSLIFPIVYNLNEKPALLPAPRNLKWTNTALDLGDGITVEYSDKKLVNLVNLTEGIFSKYKTPRNGKPKILKLRLVPKLDLQFSTEAYQLKVDSNEINLVAETPHGIFNGLQTLRQLLRDGVYIPGCEIQDSPAFAWRGFMHDVGRNYQKIDFLKEQIEVLAKYKMNIFHFHLTEDVAWRLESKKYPQLTDPAFMTRNAGEFYSQEELKDLIKFCKERYITLIPEIDMPGHSQAFKRAMGVDMQSAEGMKIVKDLLNEFCDTFDVDIIHIGGDEVKITNNAFLPEMIELLEKRGKKVMGWLPGGNLSSTVIHQLWQGNVNAPKGVAAVDSRFLYVNHHDPFESVITVFQSKILNVSHGDNLHLGAIICAWPDRRVSNQNEILLQNPVYPAILTGAERLWKGGGSQLGTTLISDLEAFKFYESRLLEHKQLYFKNKPFPYIKQTATEWLVSESMDNGGDLKKVFKPEIKGNLEGYKTQKVVGNTIYLRHWWYPMAEGLIKNPKENTTVYATTKVWSNSDRAAKMWIGFDNISRSMASDSPPIGQWDHRFSKIWLNGELIPPYTFARAGSKGNLEVPLVDESYEYRKATIVNLKKGWNTILVKAPVGSFKSTWEKPVKWMFTAAVLDDE